MREWRLDWLSVVAALGVVLIHVPVYFPVEGYYESFVVNGVCSTSVPIFFAISGYLLAKRREDHGWWGWAIKKRVFSLGVPYVFWSAAYVGIMYAIGDRGMTVANVLGLDIFRLPYFYPFWFVRNLFLLVVASPCLFFAIERHPVFLITALALLEILSGMRILPGSSLWIGLLYFTIGMYMGLRSCALTLLTKRRAFIVMAFAITLFYAGVFWDQPLSGASRSIARMMLFIGAWYSFPDIKLPNALVGVVFPVYAMHVFVLLGLSFVVGQSHVWYGQLTFAVLCS